MGNDKKDKRKQINGQILVQLPKTGYVSGETIQGTLCISLQEQYEGHILQVSLEGIEQTKYNYIMRVPGSKTHMMRRIACGEGLNRFVDFTIPIFDFAQGGNSNVMQPGQWQIPFQIGIAEALPSSMHHFENPKNCCDLTYRVTASIINTNPAIRPVQGHQDIRIGKLGKTHSGEVVMSQDFSPITCCCCSSGKFTINGKIDRSLYYPGETVKVSINSDFTNFGKDLRCLDVELIGQLTLKANNRENRSNVIRIVQVGQEVQVSGKSLNEQISLQIPPTANYSCEGQLILLEYFIKISPLVGGCCQCNNREQFHTFRFPLEIAVKSTIDNVMHQPPNIQGNLPQNWNPRQLQSMQFSAQQSTQIQQAQAQFAKNNVIQMQDFSESAPMMHQQNQSLSMNQQPYYQ